jgi:hypothetical protein
MKTHALTTPVAAPIALGMSRAPGSARANACVDAAKVEFRDGKVECTADGGRAPSRKYHTRFAHGDRLAPLVFR